MANNDVTKLKERMVTSETKKKIDGLIKNSDPNYKYHSGLGSKKTEKVPALLVLKNEHVINGSSNSAIVLGNDKPQGPLSGLSGRGFSGTATIDICAGRQSKRVLQEDYYLSNNFEEDAARVYVSQLTEVDGNISFPIYTLNGIQTDPAKYASTVTIIADRPRILGRENIKIGTKHIGFNSVGEKINPAGIDLIAGFDAPDTEHDLQPMVKGGNLLEALSKIVDNMLKIQNTIEVLFESQRRINNALLSHTHIVDAGSLITDEPLGYKITPEVLKQMQDTISSFMSNQVEFSDFIIDYLSGLKTDKYILSQWNRVN
jgi:hypothetical protein